MLGPPRVTEGAWSKGTFSIAAPGVLKLRSQEDPSRGQLCTQARQLLQSTGDQTQPGSAVATNLATLMVNMGAKGARCPTGV